MSVKCKGCEKEGKPGNPLILIHKECFETLEDDSRKLKITQDAMDRFKPVTEDMIKNVQILEEKLHAKEEDAVKIADAAVAVAELAVAACEALQLKKEIAEAKLREYERGITWRLDNAEAAVRRQNRFKDEAFTTKLNLGEMEEPTLSKNPHEDTKRKKEIADELARKAMDERIQADKDRRRAKEQLEAQRF